MVSAEERAILGGYDTGSSSGSDSGGDDSGGSSGGGSSTRSVTREERDILGGYGDYAPESSSEDRASPNPETEGQTEVDRETRRFFREDVGGGGSSRADRASANPATEGRAEVDRETRRFFREDLGGRGTSRADRARPDPTTESQAEINRETNRFFREDMGGQQITARERALLAGVQGGSRGASPRGDGRQSGTRRRFGGPRQAVASTPGPYEYDRAAAVDTIDFFYDLAFTGGDSPGGDEIQITGPEVRFDRWGFSQGPPGELNTDVTDRLSRGGRYSEETETEVRKEIERRQKKYGLGDEFETFVTDVTGSGKAGSFAGGVGDLTGDVAAADLTGRLLIEQGREFAENLPATVQEEGAAETTEAVVETTGRVTQGQIDVAKKDPYRFAGGLTGAIVGGAVGGKVLGKGTRYTRDRVRTAGGQKVDVEDITSKEVIEGETNFPGAQDPDLYETNPAEAVRRQADDYTPKNVDEYFSERGVTEGSVLKKGLDVEPEGPGGGRGGFEAAPDETGIDPNTITMGDVLRKDAGEFTYESPGAFFGPELSTYFLRGGGRSGFSWRPGLPDLGGKPTGVLAKTDVELPDADDPLAFARELARREGETTARTKPPGVGSVEEIEAVIPPGAQFEAVQSGGSVTDILRRFGIGSEFYTEVGGRRVPLRPVAPAGARAADVDLDDVNKAVDADLDDLATGQTLDEIIRPAGRSVDRPIYPPVFPVFGSSSKTVVDRDGGVTSAVTSGGGSASGGGSGGSGGPSGGSPSTPPGSTTPPSQPPGDPTSPTTPPSEPGTPPTPPGSPTYPPGPPFNPPTPPTTPEEFDLPGPENGDEERRIARFVEGDEVTGTGILSAGEALEANEQIDQIGSDLESQLAEIDRRFGR